MAQTSSNPDGTSRGTHGAVTPAVAPSPALDRLLEYQDVHPVFQPIVSLSSGEVCAFEGLTRPGPESGFAGAADLFDAAANAGRLWELENLAWRVLLEKAEGLPDGTQLFFNCSPEVVCDARFPDALEAKVRAHPWLSPSRIVLEVTERGESVEVPGLIRAVEEMRARSFVIAVDDVGAGASGLNRVMSLRPQWLKLDRGLVQQIDRDRYRLNLIKFLIHFANLSGVSLIAEGIERAEELAALVQLGVRFGQGYYLGRPAPVYRLIDPALGDWLRFRSAEAERSRRSDPAASTLGVLAEPADAVQSAQPISEVANDLLRQPRRRGVVVMDGRRCVGWCSRQAVLEAARTSGAADPIGYHTRAGVAPLAPEAPLRSAFELLSVRDDADLASPLVIADRERVLGVVTLQAVLAAAAGDHALWGTRKATVTGLPDRVQADMRIAELIVESRGRAATGRTADHGAALIDIRRFSDFNGAFGYELGDRLLQDIADLIQSEVTGRLAESFLAHLGEDRFFLAGPRGALSERLASLRSRFDQMMAFAPRWAPGPDARPRPEHDPKPDTPLAVPMTGVGIRILDLGGVFERIDDPRQLYQIEQQLRQRSRALERASGPTATLLLTDQRHEDLRRSA
ncbi:MAG: hypothetical protein C0475_05540 [Planctomyces sp.]|nr:hypothetical protein [Planctomyces sp.]MBA4119294.1 hypothetical protein [Isosphaera sp.]